MEDTGQVKGTQIKIRNESNACAPPAPRGLHSPHSHRAGAQDQEVLIAGPPPTKGVKP